MSGSGSTLLGLSQLLRSRRQVQSNTQPFDPWRIPPDPQKRLYLAFASFSELTFGNITDKVLPYFRNEMSHEMEKRLQNNNVNQTDHCSAQSIEGGATKIHSNAENLDSDLSASALSVELLERELKINREELRRSTEHLNEAIEQLKTSKREIESYKEKLRSLNEKQLEQDLRFRKVFENVVTGIAVSNWYGAMEQCNAAFCELLGYTEEELIGAHFMPFVHPDDQELNRKKEQLLKSGQESSFELENRYVRKDGESVFVHKFVSVLPDESGKPAHIVELVTNITARKKADEELKRSEENTRAILASLSSHIAVIDGDGEIVATNPAWDGFAMQNAGVPEVCGVGSNYVKVCQTALDNAEDAEISEKVVDGLRRVLAGDCEEFRIEYSCHSPTEKRWFVMQATPLKYVMGGAVVSHQNITERKLAEEKIYEHVERLRAILGTACDAIITIDKRGMIESANQATEGLFGYTPSELVGNNVSILMPLPFRREHDSYIERFLATGEARIIGIGREVICRRKNGTTFPAELSISQVDHLGLFTGILRDISSRKEMQKHILEIAADEQRRIGLELHDGTQQELTGLSLYASALQETIQSASLIAADAIPTWQFKSEDYERLKHVAALLSKRLAETNQNVRDLAHGIMPVQIDAEGLRSALVDLASSINLKESICCEFECEGEATIPNNTTATHLYRIAQEAVNNGLRHGFADRIRITLTQEDDRIALEVSDNGVGFGSDALGGGPAIKGLGMRTMEYRASLIGGRLQIHRVPKGGTLVRCEIVRGGEIYDG